MTSANNYMKSLKLTNDLQNQVRRYLSYIWEMDYRMDVTTIAKQLNE